MFVYRWMWFQKRHDFTNFRNLINILMRVGNYWLLPWIVFDKIREQTFIYCLLVIMFSHVDGVDEEMRCAARFLMYILYIILSSFLVSFRCCWKVEAQKNKLFITKIKNNQIYKKEKQFLAWRRRKKNLIHTIARTHNSLIIQPTQINWKLNEKIMWSSMSLYSAVIFLLSPQKQYLQRLCVCAKHECGERRHFKT
jgi:hypothetical protein